MSAQYRYLNNLTLYPPVISLALLLFLFLLPSGGQLYAERARMEEARQVSQNWLNYMVFQKGQWAGEERPNVMDG